MELWHGSPRIVRTPQLALCRPHNDYGPAFYCTPAAELAREWACPETSDGIANCYSVDLASLSVLDLNHPRCSILTWLAILLQHRIVSMASPVAHAARAYLIERFAVDLEPYDVVRGPRADDSYFSFARAFLNNTISVDQLARAMRLGTLGEQYALRSAAAFELLEFRAYEVAPGELYGARRLQRDLQARTAYQDIAAQFDATGLYVRDIIAQEVSSDDPRLLR